MNLQTIRDIVAQLVPSAKDIRTREAGGEAKAACRVHALIAAIAVQLAKALES